VEVGRSGHEEGREKKGSAEGAWIHVEETCIHITRHQIHPVSQALNMETVGAKQINAPEGLGGRGRRRLVTSSTSLLGGGRYRKLKAAVLVVEST
jgi:hypothetical protein